MWLPYLKSCCLLWLLLLCDDVMFGVDFCSRITKGSVLMSCLRRTNFVARCSFVMSCVEKSCAACSCLAWYCTSLAVVDLCMPRGCCQQQQPKHGCMVCSWCRAHTDTVGKEAGNHQHASCSCQPQAASDSVAVNQRSALLRHHAWQV